MSYRLATYLSLIIIIGTGGLFYYVSLGFTSELSHYVGPGTFPKIISILIIIFGLISLFTTIKKEHENIELPHFRLVAFTIIITLIFILVWQQTGLFYLFAPMYSFVLIYTFNPVKSSINKILITSSVSLILVGLVYSIFELLLNIPF